MRLENLLLGVLAVSVMSIALGGFYGNMRADYSGNAFGNATDAFSEIETDFTDASDRVADLTVEAYGTEDTGIRGEIKGIPIIGTIFSGLQIAATALSALFSAGDVISAMLTTLFDNPYFGLQASQVWDLVYAAVIVMILFAILFYVLKVKG